jgi:hypothetical protein
MAGEACPGEGRGPVTRHPRLSSLHAEKSRMPAQTCIEAGLRRHEAIPQRPRVIRQDQLVSITTPAGVACGDAPRLRPADVSSRDERRPEGEMPIEVADQHILASRDSCRGSPILTTDIQATGVSIHDPCADQNGEQARNYNSHRFCPAPIVRQRPDAMLVLPQRWHSCDALGYASQTAVFST